jgi:hypothetical protein
MGPHEWDHTPSALWAVVGAGSISRSVPRLRETWQEDRRLQLQRSHISPQPKLVEPVPRC